jgi:putative PIN family toxin of toxin-antitoxin system
MIRVVLDTNIIVSAMIRSGGFPDAIFNLAVDRVIQLCISDPVLAEYEEVLRRARFNIPPEKVANALARIRAAAVLVTPSTTVTAASDPDDNIFLECAEAANAHYVVTGNQADFPELWAGAQIVTPRQFHQIIAEAKHDDPA